MQTSSDGLKIIKDFEGERLQAYLCPAGIWTIGYGHTDAAGPPKVTPGMVITKRDAEDILRRDLRQYENAVDSAVKVALTQNQFDALVSFCFNVGAGAFRKSSLLTKLNRGDYASVPGELMKWNKGGGKELPGLTRRRRAEAALWRKIDETQPLEPEDTRVVPDAPTPKKTIVQSREANTAAITGATAGLAAVSETSGHLKDVSDNTGLPVIWIFLAIAIACALIWFFRLQRLKENGE